MQDRRTFLKKLIALGVAAPGAGALSRRLAVLAREPEGRRAMQAEVAMSSRQMAGQRVIYSYPGLTVPGALLELIVAGEVAGVIFFGENIESVEQIAAVCQQLDDAQRQSPVSSPLLLMTDQEGGPVRRLPGPPEQSAKEIGQSADPAAAASEAGAAAGQNLASAGMNVNLAPVLGVYRQPGDFLDQFERSFGQDPGIVSVCGGAWITAQQGAGVAATAKHFPGLGTASASENTDLGPVTLPVSLETLREVDEFPYWAAIEAGVKLVMLSWAVYPELDPDYPAGLSATVVRGELRERLGFQGVTITDALEAGSLNPYGSTGERGVLAAAAGMDLILCSARDVAQGQAVTTALAGALDAGQLDPAEFEVALQRVTALRNDPGSGRYFPETGHWVNGNFLSYWDQFGGLLTFGYPISDEYVDAQGFSAQYFERARFELHPGALPQRYDVELGLLGVELAQQQGLTGTQPFQPVEGGDDANCTFFPETGHRLCFGMRDFWNSRGGLAIFGFPISEEFQDSVTGFTVQYFERQRLEWHPENPPDWQIVGGLLGSDLYAGE